MMKKYRELEKIVRGFSNHRRIEMLELLQKEPELSVVEIANTLDINMKTAAEHIRRLHHSGLIWKRSEAAAVRHALSPRGKVTLKFLKTLE